MTSRCLPCDSESNLVCTFPRQYVNESNQVYWTYPCEGKGRSPGKPIRVRLQSVRVWSIFSRTRRLDV
jgi:hypothetical protein